MLAHHTYHPAEGDEGLPAATEEAFAGGWYHSGDYRHPEIMEAAVVAKPDGKWGETPCAFVTLKEGARPVTAAEVIAFCRANMAGFKVPRYVVFGPLPKTSTGKVQKFVLREQAKRA